MSGHWSEDDRRLGERRVGDRRGGDRRGGIWVRGGRRVHVGLFLFVVACIVYGSLYPFQSFERHDDMGAVVFLLNTAGDWNRPTNPVATLLLYTPFAFLGMFALPPGIHAQLRVMMTLAGGIVLSGWLELAQYQDVGHIPTMADVYVSVAGLAIGIALALLAQGMRMSLMRDLDAGRVQVLLLIMWAGERLHPYVPATGHHDIWQAVAPLLDWSGIDAISLGRTTVRWMMVACLVDSLFGLRRWVYWFPLLVLGEFAARMLLLGRPLTTTDTGGALLILVLWPVLRWLPVSRYVVLVAFAALVVVIRLAPFTFVGIPGAFGWLPFKALMDGSVASAVRAAFSDGFLYGGLIWLLTICGLGVGGATALTTAMLLMLSMAQTWQPDRHGEITEVLVVLAVGGVLALLQGDAAAPRVAVAVRGDQPQGRRASDQGSSG